MLRRGDAVDTDLVFAHRLVYLDLVDLDLWGDLLGRIRQRHARRADAPPLVGQAVYVAGILPPEHGDGVRAAPPRLYRRWLGVAAADRGDGRRAHGRAITALVASGNPLRAALITRGAAGCTLVTPVGATDVPAFPVAVQDTTGAGDAFAAGFAYGWVRGWEAARCARFANAVGGLATRGMGAQASLPTRDEVEALLQT